VRLRPLTEAECYARCYGDVRSDQVIVLRPEPRDAGLPPARDTPERRPAQLREEAA